MNKWILSLMILLNVSVVKAESACFFGEKSQSYLSLLSENGEPTFQLLERISLFQTERVNGLTDFEKQSIVQFMKDYFAEQGYELAETDEGILEEFIRGEGYIARFRSWQNFQEYFTIAYYPGDNEHGYIYKLNRDQDFNFVLAERVAEIGDGDLYNCLLK